MSSASGSSVGNMPPRHGKKSQLVDVMDGVFKANSKLDEEDGEDELKSEDNGQAVRRLVEVVEEAPVIEQPPGYTMSSVYPPQPCERCVRAKKTCKGIAGSRCEHCRILHQKCSNSTGPPRGRHAVAAAARLSMPLNAENGSPGPSIAQVRPKRKAANNKKKLDDADDDDDDEDDDEENKPVQVRKKRRAGNSLGPRRARLLKDVAELEVSIKRLQTTFVKDLAKLQQIAGTLAAEIREMDDD